MKVISIIGRPNVGKSTIFNRLNQSQHKAITHDMSGVTRDRHYSIVNFNEGDDEVKNEAIVVDTGGFFPNKLNENGEKEKVVVENKYFNIMASHARAAIDESDLVMLVVDAREGLQPFDQAIMNFIRQTNKRCWVIVNKLDSQRQQGLETDFYSLGVENDDLFPISAAHGNGFYELRMRIKSFLEEPAEIDHDLKGIVPQGEVYARLALIGAPNVGKSTLLNALLETNRALVSDEAGTTRDPIEGYFNINFAKEFAAEKIDDENSLKTIQIVDTAGIRKMNKVDEHLESQSVYRSLRAIAESDVVIIVIDANKGIGHHEKRLCDIATDKGKSLVICINKYDLVKGNLPSSSEKKLWLEDLLYKAHWLSYCEVITISALKGMGIEQLKQSIKKTIISRLRKIPTPALNRVLTELVERNSIIPSSKMRVAFKIKYATQVKNNPPTFLIFGNRSKELPEHYRRYLKNGLRAAYDFVGSPIHLLIKNANEMKEEGRNKGASPTKKVIEGKRTLPRREKIVEKRTPRRGRERVGVRG